MRIGIEIEHCSRLQDPVPSWALTVVIPWKWRRSSGMREGWGWRAKTWRFYYGNV
jgi:hypothetical protein